MGTRKTVKVPRNPLIDGASTETIDRVAIMQTWLHFHPRREVEGGYAEHIVDKLRCGDMFINDMIVDALEYESKRLDRA